MGSGAACCGHRSRWQFSIRGITRAPQPRPARRTNPYRDDLVLFRLPTSRHRLIEDRNTFGVLPTGSGKSLCFQLAAECLQDKGLTLVVSPLIALMADQNKRSPPGVTFLNSTLRYEEGLERRECLWQGAYRLLYVTPEQLGSESLLRTLAEGGRRVIRIAIDEAHCVSEWGHSFRVEYLLLRDALVRLGSPPVLLLTATAPPEVRKDVVAQLGIDLDSRKSEDLVIDHYRREELEPGVQEVRGRRNKYDALRKFVQEQGNGARGIVYTRFATAEDCENCHEIAAWLEGKGKQHGLRGPHEVLYDDGRKVLLLPFRPMKTQYTVRIAHMLALQDIGAVERLVMATFQL